MPLVVFVRRRRFGCVQVLCPRRSFTETGVQLPVWARVTRRLTVEVAAAVTTTNRAVSEVANDDGIAWGMVHRILVRAAADLLGQAAPTPMIGIDETRIRSVRWTKGERERVGDTTLTWRRSYPWMTSIVDLDRPYGGGIIGGRRAFRSVCRGLVAPADPRRPFRHHGRGDRPERALRRGAAPGTAPRPDHAGPLRPFDARQRRGHPTCDTARSANNMAAGA